MGIYTGRQTAAYCAAFALLGALATAASMTVAFRVEGSEGETPPAPRDAQQVVSLDQFYSHRLPTPLDVAARDGRAEIRKRYEDVIRRRDATINPRALHTMARWIWNLDLWQNMYWLGIPVMKTPGDMWMMQQVIAEIRPDFIIEAGTWRGGSALYYAHTLDALELDDARIITIDVQDLTAEASQFPVWQRRVDFVHGSSTDPAVVSKIAQRVEGKKVLVVLDSLHTGEHVRKELAAYAPLVSPESYIIVEDTNLDGVPLLPELRSGPMSAAKSFLASEAGAAFRADTTREIFLTTFHPAGWLLKTHGR